MTYSKQKIWDKFERWSKRYRYVCHSIIDNFLSFDEPSFPDFLFIKKWYDLDCDFTLNPQLTSEDLYSRISDKINFIEKYLVDISFDGPEFMAKNSNFLSKQYPSRCNNAMGVWLVESTKEEVKPGCFHEVIDQEIGFFVKGIEDIDLASMWNIIPFSSMYVRHPKGKPWAKGLIDSTIQETVYDLGYDYFFTYNSSLDDSKTILTIDFQFDE